MAGERYNIYRSTVHWRYAMARPHLMFFDARLIFFIALFGFHIRWWTFILLVLAIAGFTGASYFNYTLENVVRLMRSKTVGPFRPAVPYTRLRLMVDYGSDALKSRLGKNLDPRLNSRPSSFKLTDSRKDLNAFKIRN